MKFIVEPQQEEQQDRRWCRENITMCILCSEDPRWCDEWDK